MNGEEPWIARSPIVRAHDPKASAEVAIVLRGGGIKGLALVGALYELLEVCQPAAYMGTSAGAILAVLLGAGYEPEELLIVLGRTDFASFLDAGRFRALWNLVARRFLFPGDRIEEWLDGMTRAKLGRASNIPLSALRPRVIVFAAEPRFGSIVLDSEGPTSGFGAVAAARFSMSIPFVFEARNHETRPVYDGGIIRNFPLLAAMNEMGFSRDRVFGLYLGSASSLDPHYKTRGVIRDLLRIWLNQDEAQIIDRFRDRIIEIDTSPVSTLQFRLTNAEKEFLVLSGRVAAAEFLSAPGHSDIASVDSAQLLNAKERVSQLRQEILTDRRRRRRRKLVSASAALASVVLLMIVTLAVRSRLYSSSILCMSGHAYVRVPEQEIELFAAGQPQRVHVGAFYVLRDFATSAADAQCAHNYRPQPPPITPGKWGEAQNLCASIGGRLPTEAEWRSLE